MTTTLLLIIQVFIVILMVAVILVQKTSSDSLAGLSGGGNSILSNKTTSNIFSKATVILAIAFVANSIIIAKVSYHEHKPKSSILDSIEHSAPAHPQIPEDVE